MKTPRGLGRPPFPNSRRSSSTDGALLSASSPTRAASPALSEDASEDADCEDSASEPHDFSDDGVDSDASSDRESD